MNQTILRNAAMDIDSVGQYLNLASRTLQRAIITLQAERLTADPDQRKELDHVADQCGAELKLIDQAADAMQGIDKIELPERLDLQMEVPECIS